MKKVFGLLLFAGLIAVSCKKEGCLDPVSNNFDGSAEVSRGCLYTGNYTFWMNGSTAGSLNFSGIDTVNVFVEDENVGMMFTADAVATAPDCGAVGGLTGAVAMGPTNPARMHYRIETLPDGAGNVIILDAGLYEVVADSCNKIQFVY